MGVQKFINFSIKSQNWNKKIKTNPKTIKNCIENWKKNPNFCNVKCKDKEKEGNHIP